MNQIITVKRDGIEELKDAIKRNYSLLKQDISVQWARLMQEIELATYDRRNGTQLYAEYLAKRQRERERALRLSVGL
jgi:hypothetical protein